MGCGRQRGRGGGRKGEVLPHHTASAGLSAYLPLQIFYQTALFQHQHHAPLLNHHHHNPCCCCCCCRRLYPARSAGSEGRSGGVSRYSSKARARSAPEPHTRHDLPTDQATPYHLNRRSPTSKLSLSPRSLPPSCPAPPSPLSLAGIPCVSRGIGACACSMMPVWVAIWHGRWIAGI